MKLTWEQVCEWYEDEEDPLIEYPDLREFVVGVVSRFGQPPVLCYDRTRVLEHYQSEGMSYEEAVEWFEFNVIGAYVGERTPCFLDCTVVAAVGGSASGADGGRADS